MWGAGKWLLCVYLPAYSKARLTGGGLVGRRGPRTGPVPEDGFSVDPGGVPVCPLCWRKVSDSWQVRFQKVPSVQHSGILLVGGESGEPAVLSQQLLF